MYYSLISEKAENSDLVHETHCVNEPCQVHYVHQQKKLSEWKRYEQPLCQTEQFRNIVIVEETETYCSRIFTKVENVKATKTSEQICGRNCPLAA